MENVKVFTNILYVVHDDNGIPYGTSKDFDEAEKIKTAQEERLGSNVKLNISALGSEVNNQV